MPPPTPPAQSGHRVVLQVNPHPNPDLSPNPDPNPNPNPDLNPNVVLQVYELGSGTRLADTIRSLNSFTQAPTHSEPKTNPNPNPQPNPNLNPESNPESNPNPNPNLNSSPYSSRRRWVRAASSTWRSRWRA